MKLRNEIRILQATHTGRIFGHVKERQTIKDKVRELKTDIKILMRLDSKESNQIITEKKYLEGIIHSAKYYNNL